MPQIKLEQDKHDSDMVHVYFRHTSPIFWRNPTRLFYASSMSTDAVDSVFGQDVANELNEGYFVEVNVEAKVLEQA